MKDEEESEALAVMTPAAISRALESSGAGLASVAYSAAMQMGACLVLVPNPLTGAVTRVPAPTDPSCWDAEKGVLVMGNWLDKSHIVPDWAARRAGAALAASIGGYASVSSRAAAALAGASGKARPDAAKVPAFRIPRREPAE